MIGLGHMRRNLNLVRRFAARYPGGSFLMLTEAREAGSFDFPENVDCLSLPAVRKDLDGRCSARRLRVDLDELTRLRADVIAVALERFAPDVLVVDHLPCGALGELEKALETLRRNGRTRCVLGLRDILEEPELVRVEWARHRYDETIQRFYEAIWIYGDPGVFDFLTEYQLPAPVGDRARFTGYLNPAPPATAGGSEDADGLAARLLHGSPFVLCQVGGGQDGMRLAAAFVDARLPDGLAGVLLTGPFMARQEREALARRARGAGSTIHVLDFISEPTALLARAERVIAMGGYNSICEVIAFKKHALIVPRIAPRREQLIRAQRLERLGCIDYLAPEALSAGAISAWLARPPWRRRRAPVDMDGLNRASAYLEAVIEGRWAGPHRMSRVAGCA
jgi:predicted glycosyltransferase